MFKYGKSSEKRLSSCDERLQRIMREVLKRSTQDVSILCGHRTEEEQNKAFNENKSKVTFPNSKHNSKPSSAVDIAPYPIDWDDTERFKLLTKVVLSVAKEMGINIRWGGDWDMDGDTTDQTFNDLPHFELC
ncbi:MAG: M15 family metallopeptidase [Aureispira sp.]|nr:M15 family metallopeptidase [Aureispira sp.]